MTVTVDEMKTYLRVDDEDEDELIADLIWSAEKTCMDVSRTNILDDFYASIMNLPWGFGLFFLATERRLSDEYCKTI